MSTHTDILDHQNWLGYLQPDGLVVSPAALIDSGIYYDRNLRPAQQDFLDHLGEFQGWDSTSSATPATVTDLPAFFTKYLQWATDDFISDDAIPDSLRIVIKGYQETICPTYAVINPDSTGDEDAFQLLILQTSAEDLDKATEENARGWHVSPTKRFERLLRETNVPIGLLCNGSHFRIIYAPAGESPGSITFPVAAMSEISGRPILGGFKMLLDDYRLFRAVEKETLPALLKKSRDFQANVSTDLAAQVLDGLYELLRGLQSANFKTDGKLLADTLAHRPDAIYEAQLNTLMRLVFLLFAEDRGLMPNSSLYQQNYSVHALYEQLREDHERYPDTMDQRFGAWSRLLSVFRLVFDGSHHKEMSMPARMGYLFDPARFPFLEGRNTEGKLSEQGLPRIPDATIYIVLSKLLYLKGEKLSYRTLDVEQVGSVYETMMGFRLQIADGPTIAIKPKKKTGAPTNINLQTLLKTEPTKRKKWFKEQTDRDLPAKPTKAIKEATSEEEILAALENLIAQNATPQKVQSGALLLQPSDERRKSGSHYTPRKLTEPIVRKALEPILANLSTETSGEATSQFNTQNSPLKTPTGPMPSEILELKVCDPAVGSGAFLVEACRQLGDALVTAWDEHGGKPFIPADEDELLHARRLVAQRCLYGVDRNPMAADLCKLSLWLATLAKDHPFTFLDHSVRAGDSLVGLSKKQILHFHWDLDDKSAAQLELGQDKFEKRLKLALNYRMEILKSGDTMLPTMKADQLRRADDALDLIRRTGDLCIAAFFNADKKNARQERRATYLDLLTSSLDASNVETSFNAVNEIKKHVAHLKSGEFPVTPFHWEIEFPEVFERKNPGFDCFVGNPPYAGKNNVINSNRKYYQNFLMEVHKETHGNADLAAHFFRKTFDLLRKQGTIGLVTTNTIAQGDTRESGLKWLCTHDGMIYHALRRLKWPGVAAVVVSVVHVAKDQSELVCFLDGKEVPQITAFLFHDGGHESPKKLVANANLSFQGSIILGMGFTFDDTDKKGIASPLSEMHHLIKQNPKNQERIFPYIGGAEVNQSPEQNPHRYVINLSDLSQSEAQSQYPDLISILEDQAKPERLKQKDKGGKEFWWQFLRPRNELYKAIEPLTQILVCNCGATPHMAFTFLSNRMIYAHSLAIFSLESFSTLTVLQCYVHETWTRFLSSSMKDDLRYTPSDCFETFPFPPNWEENATLEAIGKRYYNYRAELMIANDEGLTKTYNRFHNELETSPEILQLRELHAEMDRAVLDAYGWTDIPTDCEFIPDFYEEDKDGNEQPKNIRYRWPDDIRDEVLARLLALNAERAKQEQLDGTAAKKSPKKKTTRKRAAKKAAKKKALTTTETITADLPGIAPWEMEIDRLAPIAPNDMRFPLGGSARYYQFLLRALIQESGGTLSYKLLHNAIVQLNGRTALESYWNTENAELYQTWENSFKEDTAIEGFHLAEEQLFVTSQQAKLTGTAPDFEIRLTPEAPAVTDPWFILDAHLLLKSALATGRAGKAEEINKEKSTQLTQWATTA